MGVNAYSGLSNKQSSDECVLAGMVLVHGYKSKEIQALRHLLHDTKLKEICEDHKDNFILPLRKTWENDMGIYYLWKSYYKNFFRTQVVIPDYY